MHEIGVREVVQWAGMTFNWETLCMTWLTMAIVLIIAFLAVRNLSLVPSGWQNVIEMVVEGLQAQMKGTMGKGGMFLAPFIISDVHPCQQPAHSFHVPAGVKLAGTHPRDGVSYQ